MKHWNLGNTTVRNPNRIKDGLRVFKKYFEGKPWTEKQHGDFCEILLKEGIIKSDTSLSRRSKEIHGRKWSACFNQLGFTKASGYKSLYTRFNLIKPMRSMYASRKKKGLAELPQSALYVIVLIVVVAVGATLVQQIRGTQTANNYDYNVTTKGLDALVQYSNWFTIIVIIVIMAVVIALLLRSFLSRGAGGA